MNKLYWISCPGWTNCTSAETFVSYLRSIEMYFYEFLQTDLCTPLLRVQYYNVHTCCASSHRKHNHYGSFGLRWRKTFVKKIFCFCFLFCLIFLFQFLLMTFWSTISVFILNLFFYKFVFIFNFVFICIFNFYVLFFYFYLFFYFHF